MCTYTTEQTAITGSGKGAAGWFAVRTATVYYDHPVHARADHTVNIDFADPSRGPAARVAVELTAQSALALVGAIRAALAAVPPALLEPGVSESDLLDFGVSGSAISGERVAVSS